MGNLLKQIVRLRLVIMLAIDLFLCRDQESMMIKEVETAMSKSNFMKMKIIQRNHSKEMRRRNPMALRMKLDLVLD
jgi:hypothetical protein